MKNLSVLFLLLLCVNVFSQDTLPPQKPRPFKRFQVGANFSPDVNYRTLMDNNGAPNNSIFIDLRNRNETIKFGYSAGLNFCYNIKSFVSVELGVQYSNKGYQTRMLQLVGVTGGP